MLHTIDNFELVAKNILQFDAPGELYMVLVLKRRKDTKGQMIEGVNEDNRLIKHYFLYDQERLYRKRDAIIALCEQNNARAYILPQRRSCELVLWALHDKVADQLKGHYNNVHFDHLIRSCVAGMHETKEKWHKRWVIDLDEDDPTIQKMLADGKRRRAEYDDPEAVCHLVQYAMFLRDLIGNALIPVDGLRNEEAEEYMPDLYHEYRVEDVELYETPHGWHLVSPPFNRDAKAMHKYFGGLEPKSEWIKTDAMTLLYSPCSI